MDGVNSPPTTIYMVEDDQEVRRVLGRRLPAVTYELCALSSAADFLAARDLEGIGCIILDVAISKPDGLELQERLVASGCRRPIIFLSGNGDIPLSVRAMKAGALNFLTKPVDDQALAVAVEEALCIDAERHAERSFRRALEQRLATLTPRERQVLEEVTAGRLNKQIAANLGTVEKTIKAHRGQVMRKLGTRSVVELVWFVACTGIVPKSVSGSSAVRLPHYPRLVSIRAASYALRATAPGDADWTEGNATVLPG